MGIIYMNFVLQPIYDESDNTITRDIKQSTPNENEHTDDYNDMVVSNKEPIVSSIDKKRLNKTVECPKCGKSMNRKTLIYSHDCQKIKQQTITNEPKPIEITEQDVHDYLNKQQTLDRDNLILQRTDRFNNMIKNIF